MSTFGITSTLSSTIRKNLSISTPDVSVHHHLPPKLNSCRPPLQYPLVFESQPPIPTCTDAPSKNMVTLLNHLPQSYQLPHHSPLFHHPLIL
ncbi:hypothetical protein TNCV_2986661 [Trichonephila clavipes]|nr:hypothetical protein TNCV_2986661 [Trichonephila clavipes]